MEPREPASRDPGFRAGGRLQEAAPHRLRGIVVVLAGIVVAGLAFAALDDSNAPTSSDAAVASTPAGNPSPLGTVLPTPIPRAAVLGDPAPTQPVPINAGWLQWLDPVSGSLSANAPTNDGSFQLAFVDTRGRAIQVCVQPPVLDVRTWRFEIDLCPFDETGFGEPRVGIAEFNVPEAFAPPGDSQPGVSQPGASSPDWPVQFDATVSPDGRWLWLATTARTDLAAWSVEVRRVDLATRSVVATRALPAVHLRADATASPQPDEWLVGTGAVIRPIVRVSPSSRRLSVTLDGVDHASDGLTATDQRRLVLDSALDATDPVTTLDPSWMPDGQTCDPALSGWATDDAYVTVCGRILGGVTIQPVARIEDSSTIIRDVEIGPGYPVHHLRRDGLSWLLNSRTGTLFQWDPDALALSSMDLATGTTATLQLATTGSVSPEPIVLPPGGTAADGSLAWAGLAPAGSDRAGLQMTASGDGRYVFLTARPPEGGFPGRSATETGPRSLLMVIDTASDTVVGREDAPAVIDELALGPGGRPLLLMPTPQLRDPQSATTDWEVPVWFVDPATGLTVAVNGRVHGPGSQPGWLLAPTVGSLAGF